MDANNPEPNNDQPPENLSIEHLVATYVAHPFWPVNYKGSTYFPSNELIAMRSEWDTPTVTRMWKTHINIFGYPHKISKIRPPASTVNIGRNHFGAAYGYTRIGATLRRYAEANFSGHPHPSYSGYVEYYVPANQGIQDESQSGPPQEQFPPTNFTGHHHLPYSGYVEYYVPANQGIQDESQSGSPPHTANFTGHPQLPYSGYVEYFVPPNQRTRDDNVGTDRSPNNATLDESQSGSPPQPANFTGPNGYPPGYGTAQQQAHFDGPNYYSDNESDFSDELQSQSVSPPANFTGPNGYPGNGTGPYTAPQPQQQQADYTGPNHPPNYDYEAAREPPPATNFIEPNNGYGQYWTFPQALQFTQVFNAPPNFPPGNGYDAYMAQQQPANAHDPDYPPNNGYVNSWAPVQPTIVYYPPANVYDPSMAQQLQQPPPAQFVPANTTGLNGPFNLPPPQQAMYQVPMNGYQPPSGPPAPPQYVGSIPTEPGQILKWSVIADDGSHQTTKVHMMRMPVHGETWVFSNHEDVSNKIPHDRSLSEMGELYSEDAHDEVITTADKMTQVEPCDFEDKEANNKATIEDEDQQLAPCHPENVIDEASIDDTLEEPCDFKEAHDKATIEDEDKQMAPCHPENVIDEASIDDTLEEPCDFKEAHDKATIEDEDKQMAPCHPENVIDEASIDDTLEEPCDYKEAHDKATIEDEDKQMAPCHPENVIDEASIDDTLEEPCDYKEAHDKATIEDEDKQMAPCHPENVIKEAPIDDTLEGELVEEESKEEHEEIESSGDEGYVFQFFPELYVPSNKRDSEDEEYFSVDEISNGEQYANLFNDEDYLNMVSFKEEAINEARIAAGKVQGGSSVEGDDEKEDETDFELCKEEFEIIEVEDTPILTNSTNSASEVHSELSKVDESDDETFELFSSDEYEFGHTEKKDNEQENCEEEDWVILGESEEDFDRPSPKSPQKNNLKETEKTNDLPVTAQNQSDDNAEKCPADLKTAAQDTQQNDQPSSSTTSRVSSKKHQKATSAKKNTKKHQKAIRKQQNNKEEELEQQKQIQADFRADLQAVADEPIIDVMPLSKNELGRLLTKRFNSMGLVEGLVRFRLIIEHESLAGTKHLPLALKMFDRLLRPCLSPKYECNEHEQMRLIAESNKVNSYVSACYVQLKKERVAAAKKHIYAFDKLVERELSMKKAFKKNTRERKAREFLQKQIALGGVRKEHMYVAILENFDPIFVDAIFFLSINVSSSQFDHLEKLLYLSFSSNPDSI